MEHLSPPIMSLSERMSLAVSTRSLILDEIDAMREQYDLQVPPFVWHSRSLRDGWGRVAVIVFGMLTRSFL